MDQDYLMNYFRFSIFKKRLFFLVCFILFGNYLTVRAQNCTVNAGVLSETICVNDPMTLQGDNPSPIIGTVSWKQIGGPSVIITTPNSPTTTVTGYTSGNTYTFRYSATCSDGNLAFQDKTVIVQPITIANAGTNITSCPASGTITLTGNTPQNTGETGHWVVSGANNAGVVINSPNSPISTITLPPTSCGTTTLSWIIEGPEYAPGQKCTSSSSITVTNYGGVTPVSAGADITLTNCYTTTQNVNLNGSFGGCTTNIQNGTWSFVSGPSTPTIANANSNTTNVSNLQQGTYVFRWSVTGTCVSGSDTVSVTVPAATQDVTTLTGGTENIAFCDNTVTEATLEGQTPLYAGETVTWTKIGTNSAVIVSPNSPTTLVTGLSDTQDPYTFRYTLTNNNTGCTSTKDYVVEYKASDRTILANNGDNIFGTCEQTVFSIPITTTGSGVNRYRILTGPAESPLAPFPTTATSVGSTLDLTLTAPGTYILQFVRSENGDIPVGCDYGFDSLTIVVSGQATPSNAGSDVSLPCGDTVAPLSGVGISGAGNHYWTQISGPNTATITDRNAQSTTATGLVSGTYEFQYITKGGGTGCALSTDNVFVYVSSSLHIGVDAGPDQTVCTNSVVRMDASTPAAGEKGTWTVASGNVDTLIIADPSDPKTTVSGFTTAGVTNSLIWTIDYTHIGATGCALPFPDTVAITTTNGIAGITANAGPDACYPASQTTISLAGNAPVISGQGTWTVLPSTGAFIVDVKSPTSAVTISAPGTYTFTWTITPLTCGVTTDSVVITIADDSTVANAGPDTPVCGDQYTMQAVLPTGATGLWTKVSGLDNFTISNVTDPHALFTFTSSGPYVFRWTITAGACSAASAFDDVKITVGLPPGDANAGPDQAICGTTTNLQGSSYNQFFEVGEWSLLAGAPNVPVLADATNPNTAVSNLVEGTYTFRWKIESRGNFICPDPSFDDVVITVVAPANAGADQVLCNVTTVQLVGTQNSTGTWTCTAASAGTIADVVITQTPANSYVANATVVPGRNYTFTYTIDARGGCPLSSDTVNVTVNAGASAPPNAGPDQTICSGTTTSITLAGNAAPSGATAGWTFVSQPSGSVAAITTSNSPTTTVTGLSVAGLYILQWTFSSPSCSTLSDIVRINVYAPPSAAQAGADNTVACQQSYTTNAVAPTVGIGLWTFASQPTGGNAVIDNPNNPKTTLSNVTVLGTYVLNWTVTNGPFTSPSACGPSVDQVSIVFNDTPPSIADAGPDQELCAATQATLAAVPVTSGKGTWTQTSGAAATIVGINNPTTTITGLTTGDYDFTWTTTTLNNDGCSSSDVMHIKIFQQPVGANAGPDQTVPQFSPVIMAATAPTVGEGRWVRISGPATVVSFANSASPTTAVAGLPVGTTVFQWRVTNGPCTVAADLVNITIVANTDLELTKLVSPTAANVGDEVTFTINVFNHDTDAGTVDATGVAVTDIIPNGYTLVPGSITNGGIFNIGNKTITWSNLSVALNATVSLSFRGTVTNGGNYSNSAEITACDQFDIDSTPNNNITTEDDQDAVAIVIQSADLSVQKTVTPLRASIGEEVVFTLSITNSGPDNATNVSVKDQLPIGYTYVSDTSILNNSGVYYPNTGLWDIGNLNNGATETFTITATVNKLIGTIGYINSAEVLSSDQFDIDSTPNNNVVTEDDQADASVELQDADLELVKTALPTSINAGGTVNFTLALTNNGPGNATGVAVTDYLPSGFSLVPGSVSNGGTYDLASSNILWQNLSLPTGTSINLTFSAIANATGNHINTAQVTKSDLEDPDSEVNNDDGDQSEDDESAAEVTIIADTVDLILTKKVVDDKLTPLVGSQITFQVTVRNTSTIDATGVQVRDLLPTGYEYVVYSSTSGNYDETTGIWDVPNVDKGTSEILLLTVNVNASGDYQNIAEVMTCDQPDVDSTPGNGITTEDDYATVTTVPVSGIADLSLTKTIVGGNTSPGIGSRISFEIIVTNNGPQDATGVQVTDLLPTGYTYNISTTSVGTYNSATGLWNIGALPNGASESLTVNATVNAAGNYTNIAEVTASNLPDPNSTPGNGVTTEDDYASVVITPITGSADLSITKTVVGGNLSPLIGSNVSFEVIVTNGGPQDPTGVQVTDLLPSGYTYNISTTSVGNYDSTTGIWNVGVLPTGQSETLTINARVNATGDYTNIAEVTASSLADPDSTPNNALATEDDYASVVVTPTTGSADLSLTKTLVGGNTTRLVGSQVTFNVVVRNDGPQNATGVAVTDLLPNGYTLSSTTVTTGDYDAVTGLWTVGSLIVGASETLAVIATVNPTGNYENIAEVSASSLSDPDSTPANGIITEDDYATVTIIPVTTSADLSLTKTIVGGNLSPLIGSNVSFEIIVTNNGPQDATGVQVTDLLPNGYTYTVSSPSAGTYNSGTGVWNVGPLPNGQSETLTVNAIVNTTGVYTNIAEVTASSLPDIDSTPNNGDDTEDDYASVVVTPVSGTADLSLTKTIVGGNTSPLIGSQVSFSVAVHNTGPNDASGVAVTDILPTGYTFVSSNLTTGTYDNTTGLWTIGSLAVGATETLSVTVTVNPTGNYTNIAEVTASSLPDPDSTPNNGVVGEDDYASVTTTPVSAGADLSLTKTIVGGNTTPLVGAPVSFEVIITNNGPQDVSGVQVTDLLPTGFTYTASSVGIGTYVPATGIWNIGTLSNGQSETLTVTGTVNPAGDYTNIAEVTASSLPDPDSTPNNGVVGEDDYASVTITPVASGADLALTKTIVGGNTSPLIGSDVSFEVVVVNNGPDTTNGVQVTDLLPSGYTYSTSSHSAGTYNTTTGVWSIGSLANGQSETLRVTATVNATGNYDNIAEVTASSLPDPDSTPNNGIATEDDYGIVIVTPVSGVADLSLTKTIVGGNTTPLIGAPITFNVVVNNDGPQNASGIVVKDLLPTGFTLVSSSLTTGSYDSVTGIWTVGSLIVGASETLTINANVNATGNYTNIAEITASTLPDIDSTPNNGVDTEDDYASVTINPVLAGADLSLTKTIVGGNTTPLVGSPISFEIIITNNGPQDTAGVQVTDLLPSGYTYSVSSPSAGSYDATTGIWNVGVLPNGQSETLTVNAKVNATGNYTNIAEVTASNLQDPDSAPNNGVTTEDDYAAVTIVPTLKSADLKLTKLIVGGNTSPAFGTTITFQVNVFNDGPQDATGVKVLDILPSGYEYVVFSSTSGVYNEVTGVWNVGTIANQSSQTLLMTVVVNSTGNYLNIAEVLASDLPDPNSTPNNGLDSEDDIGKVPLTPVSQIADLSISKLVVDDKLTPLVGTQITFQVTVSNAGPNIATNVSIKDLLPPGYTFVFYNASSGSYDKITGIWTPGIVLPNSSQTLLMNVIVNTPTGAANEYLNTTEVLTSDQFDPDSTPNNGVTTEDDYDSISVVPVIIMADLSIQKTVVGNQKPNVGDIVVFQVKVDNAGPGNAAGVEVKDLLPSGFTFSSYSATSGDYSFADGKWRVGEVLNGGEQTLLVYATVKQVKREVNEFFNVAEITASSLGDPDSTPNNGANLEDDYAAVLVDVQLADLSLEKSVSNVNANVGDVVTFTVQVNNAGPAIADGVAIEDLLPIGYSNITNISNGGIYNSFRLAWSNLVIPLNGLTITYQATVDSPVGLSDSDYVNTVQITASTQYDPDSMPDNDDGDQSEDDEAKAFIEMPKTDIAIIKTVDATDPTIDSEVNFTITADNIGNLNATNLEVQDVLPRGYQFVSASASSGTYDATTGIWKIPLVEVNTIQNLTLRVKVLDIKDYLNNARLLSLDQIDTNASNNQSSATIEPVCLKINNEFSPNDDGINDVFYIDCIANYPDNTLEIYNRWGTLVYTRKGYDNTWNGTSETKGSVKILPVGTYFYILDLGDGSPKTSSWLYLKR